MLALLAGTAIASALLSVAVVTLAGRDVSASAEPRPASTAPTVAHNTEVPAPVSMRDRMRAALEEERTRPPRDPDALAAHLAGIADRARQRGVVDAVDIASGHGALERAGASPDQFDAFNDAMATLSAELRGEPAPEGPPRPPDPA